MICRFKFAVCLVFVTAFVACTDWDEFKKYQAGGEIIYPGKGDTVLVASGRNRMQLLWVTSADPRVTKYKLYWNNKADSLVGPLSANVIGDTMKMMLTSLPEGSYNFEMFALDVNENLSVPLRFNGKTFGAIYESGLLNRSIAETIYDDSLKILEIHWNEPDTINITTELKYTRLDSKVKTISVDPESKVSQVKDWKPGTILHYRSAFIPNRRAIDVFTVTEYDTISIAIN